jgi:hypothetical protein
MLHKSALHNSSIIITHTHTHTHINIESKIFAVVNQFLPILLQSSVVHKSFSSGRERERERERGSHWRILMGHAVILLVVGNGLILR